MLKFWHDEVWAFDAEWVPDPVAIRRLYGDDAIRSDDFLKKSESPVTDDDAIEFAYRQHKDYDPTLNPRPYLKVALCQVVSVAVAKWYRNRPFAVIGSRGGEEEGLVIGRFLQAVGKEQPQLVGYNSRNADVPILLQRGIAHGVQCSIFCDRTHGNDYFHKYGGWHVDLCEIIGGYGSSTPKLAEVCAAANVPGKTDVDGGDVLALWRAGEIDRIRKYNEADALRTLALFLRLAYMAGRHATGRFALDTGALDRHPEWKAYVLPVEVAA